MTTMKFVIFVVKDEHQIAHKFKLEMYLLPENSHFNMLIKYKDSMRVSYNIDAEGTIFDINDISVTTFTHIEIFLRTGKLPDDEEELMETLMILDREGLLAFDFHKYFQFDDIPLKFMKILQEEEWFRIQFNKENFEYLHSDLSMLFTVDDILFSKFDIITQSYLRHITSITSNNIYNERLFGVDDRADYEESLKSGRLLYFPDHITKNAQKNLSLYVSSLDSPSFMYKCKFESFKEKKNYAKKIETEYMKYKKLREYRNNKYGKSLVESNVLYCNFNNADVINRVTITEIKNSIKKFLPINFDFSNVLIAGGFIVDYLKSSKDIYHKCAQILILPRTKPNDIDIFIYGLNTEECTVKLNSILKQFKANTYVRSKNCVTFKYCYGIYKCINVQVILRCYSSKAEILLGFDVDCSSLGFDGNNILMTPRAVHSFKHGFNVVNLARASPTYSFRLAKYNYRAFSVYVPGFDNSKITTEMLANYKDIYMKCLGSNEYRASFKNNLKQTKDLAYIILMANIRLYSEFKQISDYETGRTNVDRYYSFNNWGTGYMQYHTKKYSTVNYNINYSTEKKLDYDFKIPDELYNAHKWSIDQEVCWKVQNVSEQLTNTFNKIIIDNPKTWYNV